MFDWNKAGFLFLGQTKGWDHGFQSALSVLEQSSGDWLNRKFPPLLLLGPKVNESARRWIMSQHFTKEPQLFGKNLLDWQDWLRGYARDSFSEQGKVFRELTPLRARDFLRRILAALEQAGKLKSVGPLWKEEQFFRTILKEVLELREAGFDSLDEVLRAREVLQLEKTSSRMDPEELWYILSLFEEQLIQDEAPWNDRASTLRAAAARKNQSGAGYFLLGFERFSPLEILFLQNLARENKLVIPVMGKASPSHALIRDLVVSFAGDWTCHNGDEASHQKIPVAVAHTPTEEAMSAGAWLRAEAKPARIILSSQMTDSLVMERFFLGLGITPAAEAMALTQAKSLVLERLHQALEMPERGFALDAICDYAELLVLCKKNISFLELGPKLAKLGFRQGLGSLHRLAAEDPILTELFEELKKLNEALPLSATGREFSEKLKQWIENSSWSEWVRTAKEEQQSELHTSYAVIINASAQLAGELRESWTRKEWLSELRVLTESFTFPEALPNYQRLEWYQVGDWIPPAAPGSLTLALGLSSAANPRLKNRFYLDNQARTRLAEWRLECQGLLDAEALQWFEQLAASSGPTYFSFARHTQNGNEQGHSWILDLYGAAPIPWPQSSWNRSLPPAVPSLNFVLDAKNLPSLSVTALDRWGDCPFRAWGESLERLHDGWIESDLDLPSMDQGAAFHKAVELFYTTHKGRQLIDPKEIEREARLALEEAFSDREFQYFKGGKGLLSVHKEQLARFLVKMLLSQAEYFASFPDLGDPICEKEFSLQLDGVATEIKGKIDRIDRSRDGKHILVIDYKTGASTPKSATVVANEKLQLPLYLHYASRALEADPVGGYYLQLKDPKDRQGILREQFRRAKGREGPFYFDLNARNGCLVKEDQFFDSFSNAKLEAKARIEAINRGEFSPLPKNPEDCERCSLRPVCRIHTQFETELEVPLPRQGEFLKFRERLNAQGHKVEEAKKNRLTDEQELAVAARSKLTFVEASAGTGKTSVLVERIAREIAEQAGHSDASHALERILAISFTEKSTQELKERIAKRLLPEYGPLLAAQATHRASTIHGFCGKVVRDFPSLAQVSPLVETLTGLDAKELQEEVLEDFFISPTPDEKSCLDALYPIFSRRQLHAFLLDVTGKRALLELDEAVKAIGAHETSALRLAWHFFARYDKEKFRRSVLDFNDLERLALKVLQEKSAYYRDQFSLVLVDEFQDTNSLQRKIVESVAQANLTNLFVVGDAKQSIYRFRDADVAIFQSLREEAAAKEALFSLSKNFRSQAKVVSFVNELCSRVMPLEGEAHQAFEAVFGPAEAYHPPSHSIQMSWHDQSKEAEANLVAEEVSRLLAQGRSPGDIAILFRKLSRNQAYGEALKRLKIPYVQEGGEDFFADSVIVDGISLLRAMLSPWNRLSLVAILRSPWFNLSAQEIAALVQEAKAKNSSLWKLLESETKFKRLSEWLECFLLHGAGRVLRLAYGEYPAIEDPRKRAQIDKLLAWVAELEARGITGHSLVRQFSRWAGYESKVDGIKEKCVPEDNGGRSVRLSTIHAAKGLEYPVTLIVDLDAKARHETNPLRYYPGLGLAIKDPEGEDEPPEFTAIVEANKARDLAESKRLLYVATTRSQEEMIFFCRRKESKQENWGDLFRKFAHQLPLEQKEALEETRPVFESQTMAESPSPTLTSVDWKTLVYPPHSTVSELAAFEFCPEFHRLKFVKTWEDALLEYFPKDPRVLQKLRKPLAEDTLLLRKLGLEKKERGIALHRVLERMEFGSGSKEWREWFKEIYVSQGAKADREELNILINKDIELVEKFLASSPGQQLFGQGIKSFSEMPFVLDVSHLPIVGAVDRIVSTEPGSWIVADYKSSLGDGNRARYTLQVWTYMFALAKELRARGVNPQIKGILVDVFELEWLEISNDVWSEAQLKDHLAKIRASYTQKDILSVSGGKHCFHCPYVTHCDVGRNIVLSF